LKRAAIKFHIQRPETEDCHRLAGSCERWCSEKL